MSATSIEKSLVIDGPEFDRALSYASQAMPFFEGKSFIPILGNASAGRTTLLRYLSGQSFDQGISDVGFPIAIPRASNEHPHLFTAIEGNEFVGFSLGHFWKAPALVSTASSSPNPDTILEISVAMRFAKQVKGWLCVVDYLSLLEFSDREGENKLLSQFASLIRCFSAIDPNSVLFIITRLPAFFEMNALHKGVCRQLNQALAKIRSKGQSKFEISERNVLLSDVCDQGESRAMILQSIANLTPISGQAVIGEGFLSIIHSTIRRILQAQEDIAHTQVQLADLQAQSSQSKIQVSQDRLLATTEVKEFASPKVPSPLQKKIAELEVHNAQIVKNIAFKEREIKEKDSDDPIVKKRISLLPPKTYSVYLFIGLGGFFSSAITAISTALLLSNTVACVLISLGSAIVGGFTGALVHKVVYRKFEESIAYESPIPILRVEKNENQDSGHFFNEHFVPNAAGGKGFYHAQFEGYLGSEDTAEVVIYVKSCDYHRELISALRSQKHALEQERIGVYWELERCKIELLDEKEASDQPAAVAVPCNIPLNHIQQIQIIMLRMDQLKSLLKASERYFPLLRSIITLFFQVSLTPDMRAFLVLMDKLSPSDNKLEQQPVKYLDNARQFLAALSSQPMQTNLGQGESPELYRPILSPSPNVAQNYRSCDDPSLLNNFSN